MPEVSQRSVLITGAARRIGRRLAIDLAQEGWAVAIHCNESIEDAKNMARAPYGAYRSCNMSPL